MDMPIVSPANTAFLREPEGGFYAVNSNNISNSIVGLFPFESNARKFMMAAEKSMNWNGKGYPPFKVIRVTFPSRSIGEDGGSDAARSFH